MRKRCGRAPKKFKRLGITWRTPNTRGYGKSDPMIDELVCVDPIKLDITFLCGIQGQVIDYTYLIDGVEYARVEFEKPVPLINRKIVTIHPDDLRPWRQYRGPKMVNGG